MSNDNRREAADWLDAMPWPQTPPGLKARIMARLDDIDDVMVSPAFMVAGMADAGRPMLARLLTIAVVVGLSAGMATSRIVEKDGPGLPYASAVYGGAGLSLAGLFTGGDDL